MRFADKILVGKWQWKRLLEITCEGERIMLQLHALWAQQMYVRMGYSGGLLWIWQYGRFLERRKFLDHFD